MVLMMSWTSSKSRAASFSRNSLIQNKAKEWLNQANIPNEGSKTVLSKSNQHTKRHILTVFSNQVRNYSLSLLKAKIYQSKRNSNFYSKVIRKDSLSSSILAQITMRATIRTWISAVNPNNLERLVLHDNFYYRIHIFNLQRHSTKQTRLNKHNSHKECLNLLRITLISHRRSSITQRSSSSHLKDFILILLLYLSKAQRIWIIISKKVRRIIIKIRHKYARIIIPDIRVIM